MIDKFDILRVDAYSLSIFVSVCETQSVSKTAAAFEVGQSTVSHTIEKLRKIIGDPLFVKAGRGITPTDRAMSMLPRAKQIVADIEGLPDGKNYDIAEDSRPVVVAISTPAVVAQMKQLHRDLRKQAPGVKLVLLRLSPRSDVVDVLSRGEADLAISLSARRYQPVLNSCLYETEELVVYYDADCRPPVRTLQDYINARHGVAHLGGVSKNPVEQALERLGLQLKVSIVAPTASMLGELIRGTDLVATMPKRLATGPYRGLSQVAPPLKIDKVRYDLVWHRRSEHSGRNQWLRRAVLDTLNQ